MGLFASLELVLVVALELIGLFASLELVLVVALELICCYGVSVVPITFIEEYAVTVGLELQENLAVILLIPSLIAA